MTTPAAMSYALLSDGSTVEIRPAQAADADDIQHMHEQCRRITLISGFLASAR